MSAALDLAGAAHTITADTTEMYFTVTDSVGGGTLTIEAGAALEFDDLAGAGFLSTSLAFTLMVTGTSTAWASITSTESYPNHRWTLPPAATTVNVTRCQLRDYTGDLNALWVINNPSYVTDIYVYATIAELKNLTGSDQTDDVLMEILAHCTRRLNARLASVGITVSGAGDRTLQTICLDYAVGQLITRYKMDGTVVGSVNVDGFTSQPNLLDHIKYYDDRANYALDMYIALYLPSTHSRLWAYKVNAHG